jgi:MioC protein
MPLEIIVLVGSMTGTARMVAQELELAFAGDDVAIRVVMMDGLDHSVFAQPGVFLICTSTYGQGDVPDNAKALYADLLGCRADLSGVRYGVFALGDRTHVGTFCFGGKRFDEALSALGARRCGPVFEHNASGGTLPEDVALEWFPDWLDSVRTYAVCADSSDAAYQSR